MELTGRVLQTFFSIMFLKYLSVINNNHHLTGQSDSKVNYTMVGSLAGIGCLAFILAGALVYAMKRSKQRKVSPSPTIAKVLSMPEEDEASL